MKKLGLFAAGVLFGTAGIKLLGSRDAKKVYAHTTAAALRAKEDVMKTVTAVREGADDIYAEAKAINAVSYTHLKSPPARACPRGERRFQSCWS